MRFVEISVRMGCANNCDYCPQQLLMHKYYKENKKTETFLSLEKYKYYLSKIPEDIAISFAGMTDPFFNPEAFEMMEYAAQKGHKLMLFSSLRGLNLEQIKRLNKIDFDMICIHTPDRDGCMKYKADDEYLENIRYMKEHNPKASFIVAGRADERIAEILDNKVEEITISSRANNLDLAKINKNVKVKITQKVADNIPVFCNVLFWWGHKTLDTPFEVEKSILLPDGSLLLCCQDYGMEHVLGNLNDNTYDEIIHGEKMKEITDAMQCKNELPLLCRECDSCVVYDKKKWQNYKATGVYQNPKIGRHFKWLIKAVCLFVPVKSWRNGLRKLYK